MCFTITVEVAGTKNSICFAARAPRVRDAEKFCRILSAEFPALSSTKYAEFAAIQKNPKFKRCVEKLYEKDYNEIRVPLDKARDIYGFKEAIFTLIEKVKEHKIANCADLSKLCSAICHINGVEVIQPELRLVTKDGALTEKFIDHAVLMIKQQKMPFIEKLKELKDVIIIDPWLGFADFAPNIERKYKGEYSKFFKINDDFDIALTPYTPQGIRFSEETIAELKEKYPQLIIKNRKHLLGDKK